MNLLEKLKEPTTWKGLGWLLVAVGIVPVGAVEPLVSLGVALVGVVEIVRKDQKK